MKIIKILLPIFLLSFMACSEAKERYSQEIITFHNFESIYVPARNIEVYLPEGYNPCQTYDVLYMHDGQNVFNPHTSYTGISWGVKEAIDSLLKEDKIRPVIVVAIWNTSNRFLEYMPNEPRESLMQLMAENNIQDTIVSDDYLKFIVHELKPFIDRKFGTNPRPEATFIMGSSMGGLISMYAVCQYPEVFGGAACLSTHWPIADGIVLEYFRDNLPDPANHRFYFDFGTVNLDSIYEPYQLKADQMLRERGYDEDNWVTLKFDGADHNESSWRERIHVPLKFLFGK
jgi:enterochelin esterase-like enzyme